VRLITAAVAQLSPVESFQRRRTLARIANPGQSGMRRRRASLTGSTGHSRLRGTRCFGALGAPRSPKAHRVQGITALNVVCHGAPDLGDKSSLILMIPEGSCGEVGGFFGPWTPANGPTGFKSGHCGFPDELSLSTLC